MSSGGGPPAAATGPRRRTKTSRGAPSRASIAVCEPSIAMGWRWQRGQAQNAGLQLPPATQEGLLPATGMYLTSGTRTNETQAVSARREIASIAQQGAAAAQRSRRQSDSGRWPPPRLPALHNDPTHASETHISITAAAATPPALLLSPRALQPLQPSAARPQAQQEGSAITAPAARLQPRSGKLHSRAPAA